MSKILNRNRSLPAKGINGRVPVVRPGQSNGTSSVCSRSSHQIASHPDIEPIQFEHNSINYIKVHIHKILTISESLVQSNSGTIIQELQLLKQAQKLEELFLNFHQDYIKERNSNNFVSDKDPKYSFTPLRSSSTAFLKRWKIVNDIIDKIRQDGISSLGDFVREQINITSEIVNIITSKTDKFGFNVEQIQKWNGILSDNWLDATTAISNHFDSFGSHPSDMQEILTNIRDFLQVFNDAFYQILPKYGFSPNELAKFKTTVSSSCNLLLRAITASFSFGPTINSIIDEISIINKSLVNIIERLGLPLVFISSVSTKQIEYIPPLPEYPSDKSTVRSSGRSSRSENDPRLMRFITIMQDKFDEKRNPTDSPWNSLNIIQERIMDLFRQNNELKNELNEKQATILNKDMKIKQLESRSGPNGSSEKCIKRLSEKMGSIMNDAEKQYEELLPEEDKPTNVDKMSVFILERRCQRCLQMDQMEANIRKTLKGVVNVRPGESVESIIASLRKQQEQLAAKYTRLEAASKDSVSEIYNYQEKTQFLLDELRKLGINVPGNTIEDLVEAFHKLKTKNEAEYEELKTTMSDAHTKELGMILQQLNKLYPDSDEYIDLDISTMIKRKIMKAEEKMMSMSDSIQENTQMLNSIKVWMTRQIPKDKVPKEAELMRSLHVLMKAIDNEPNPLQAKLKNAESDLKATHKQLSQVATKLATLSKFDIPEVSELSQKELINVNENLMNALSEKQKEDELVQERAQLELKMNRSSLETVAEKLRHLIQKDENDISLKDKDSNDLLFHITTFLEELTSGSATHFMSIAQINEITKESRKLLKQQNLNTPGLYLPEICKEFEVGITTLNHVSRYEESLKAIFQNFNFKDIKSYDPNNESFAFLRSKIYQMHLFLGEDRKISATLDKNVFNVVDKFIVICTSLFSFIASTTLSSHNKETPTNMFPMDMNQQSGK